MIILQSIKDNGFCVENAKLSLRAKRRNRIFVAVVLLLPIVVAIIGYFEFHDFVDTFIVPRGAVAIGMLLVVSPILEEIVFRGLLQDLAVKRLPRFARNDMVVVVLPNMLFTLWHYHVNHSYLYLLLVFISGLVFGVAKLLQNRLIYSIILHSYYNLVFLVLVWMVFIL